MGFLQCPKSHTVVYFLTEVFVSWKKKDRKIQTNVLAPNIVATLPLLSFNGGFSRTFLIFHMEYSMGLMMEKTIRQDRFTLLCEPKCFK